jgi:shikimate kinase
VKRVLLTGMSGTGKSTVILELARRGYKAVDLDCDEWSEWVTVGDQADGGPPADPGADYSPADVWRNRDWVWREARVRDLLSGHTDGLLFVSGTAANQGELYRLLDHVILLSAPTPVIVERLSTRTNNPYGKHPDEVARVIDLIETIEPLIRRRATAEVDTSPPLEHVVDTILRLVEAGRR